MTKPAPKLRLLSAADVTTEKAVEAHFKAIRLAINASQRAGVHLFAQMVIAGNCMNALVEILPHGQYEKRLAEKFPTLSLSTQKFWRTMAVDFLETVKTKRLTVSLLDGKGKLKGNAKTRNVLLEIIPEIMEGRNAREFMQHCKLLREPEPDGYRYDKKLLAAWLDHHPAFIGLPYEELPAAVQRAFRKFAAGQKVQELPQQTAEDEAEEIKQTLLMACTSKNLKAISDETRQLLKDLAKKLIDKLNGMGGSL